MPLSIGTTRPPAQMPPRTVGPSRNVSRHARKSARDKVWFFLYSSTCSITSVVPVSTLMRSRTSTSVYPKRLCILSGTNRLNSTLASLAVIDALLVVKLKRDGVAVHERELRTTGP